MAVATGPDDANPSSPATIRCNCRFTLDDINRDQSKLHESKLLWPGPAQRVFRLMKRNLPRGETPSMWEQCAPALIPNGLEITSQFLSRCEEQM